MHVSEEMFPYWTSMAVPQVVVKPFVVYVPAEWHRAKMSSNLQPDRGASRIARHTKEILIKAVFLKFNVSGSPNRNRTSISLVVCARLP
jgi:hypothetical protein